MKKRRIVITGVGIVSAIGNNIEAFYESIKNGTSGVDIIKAFDLRDWKYQYGAEIKYFDPTEYFSHRESRNMDRASQISLVAAAEALEKANFDLREIDVDKVGVCLGTTLGGMISAGSYYKNLKKNNTSLPSLLREYPLYTVGNRIGEKYGFCGPNFSVSTACSSGNIAIGYSADLIRSGKVDIMVAGGFDTMCEMTWAGFGVLRNVSTKICQPFDKNREGLILGEGAGILVLEEYESAKKRNATIYAEVAGYGMSSDAYHMTSPDLTGTGPALAISNALEDAGIDIGKIDYINAHGTGTKYNDLIETKAIKAVFGERAKDISISSTKSMTGHTLGAAGAIEAIACVIAIREGFVPPTINYETPDPDCNLNYTPNKRIEKKIDYALSNNFGFGGNNCSVIITRYER